MRGGLVSEGVVALTLVGAMVVGCGDDELIVPVEVGGSAGAPETGDGDGGAGALASTLNAGGAAGMQGQAGSGGAPGTATDNPRQRLLGAGQKGPFINGSTVLIQELDTELEPTGRSFTTETLNNLGAFEVGSRLDSPFVETIISGFFFNEVTETLSGATMTLRAISDTADTTAVNVNVLTHLERQRLKTLRKGGASFTEARRQAQSEVLAVFGITGDFQSFNEMDVTQEGQGNAVLLAVSAILTQMAIEADSGAIEAELAAILSTIIADLEDDGTLESEPVRERITEASVNLDLPAVRSGLQDYLEDLGVAHDIPEFEQYVDSDGDGIVTIEDDNDPEHFSFATVVDAALGREYRSEVVTLTGLHHDGHADLEFEYSLLRGVGTSSFGFGSYEPPRLLVNGAALRTDTSRVTNGDTLQLRVAATFDYDHEINSIVSVGDFTTTYTVTSRAYGDKVAVGTIEEPLTFPAGSGFDILFPTSVDTTASYYAIPGEDDWPIELTELSDNVDLYMFSTSDFASELICATSGSNLERKLCDPGAGSAPIDFYYLMVDGSKTTDGALFNIHGAF